MIDREQDRRQSQAVFYDAISDRRTIERRDRGTEIPAIPGMIRPAPGEVMPFRERRRVPDSGME